MPRPPPGDIPRDGTQVSYIGRRFLYSRGFLGGSVIKNPSAEAEAWVQSLGWKDLLGNPTARGAWWATVYGVAKS